MSSTPVEGILSCLESAMKPFGDSFSGIVFYNLNKSRKVSREEAVDKAESLVECLREIFGAGSKVIEQKVCQELKNRFSLSDEDSSDCLRAIRASKRQVLLVPA